MSNLNDLVEITGCDNPDRWGDVIFVHGLGGNARGTWHPQERQDDNNFWPAWLGADLPKVGIWSLGYEVEPFKWKGSAMPLADRATNILDLLDSYGIGDRPLIFITHSLGGLLVKQMLRSARDFGKWKAIASKTNGIVFLSTPHSGSDMASWIQHIGGILRTTVSVEELEAHHSRLRELNLLYRNDEQFSQVPMLIYCETRPTGPILVVNQTSADPGIKGVIPIPMDFDHISICKVADKKSQIYRQVKQFIEKNLIIPLAPIPPKLPEGEAIPQEIDRCQPQTDNSMKQTNQGDARAFQNKIEGGTAYIGEIQIYQSPKDAFTKQQSQSKNIINDKDSDAIEIIDSYVIDNPIEVDKFKVEWLKKENLPDNSISFGDILIDIKTRNLSKLPVVFKEIKFHLTPVEFVPENSQICHRAFPRSQICHYAFPVSYAYHVLFDIDTQSKNPIERTLKLSQVIQPKDVDRFVIVVGYKQTQDGTTKCNLRLELFYNKSGFIKAGDFLINMCPPIYVSRHIKPREIIKPENSISYRFKHLARLIQGVFR